MDFRQATDLFSHAADLDRRLVPPSEQRGLTIVASWCELLREVPMDFAMHQVSRYYATPEPPSSAIGPGVILVAWRQHERREADRDTARRERAKNQRPRDPERIFEGISADTSDDDIIAMLEARAGDKVPPHLREKLVRDVRLGAARRAAKGGPVYLGGFLGSLIRGAPAHLREQMRADIDAAKVSHAEREKRLRRVGADQFRYENAQAVREKEERERQEYRDRAEEPEPPRPEADPDDVAERHCGNSACHCSHTRCRAGWDDGPDVLVETRFGTTHAVERCPNCWDAVLMRGERV